MHERFLSLPFIEALFASAGAILSRLDKTHYFSILIKALCFESECRRLLMLKLKSLLVRQCIRQYTFRFNSVRILYWPFLVKIFFRLRFAIACIFYFIRLRFIYVYRSSRFKYIHFHLRLHFM